MSAGQSAIQTAILHDRALVRVSGPDARKLLQGIITNDLDVIAPGKALFAGLLSPQGKILFEFFIANTEDGFLLDVADDTVSDLIKRLTMYRLRANVTMEDESRSLQVHAAWGDGVSEKIESRNILCAFRDPRLADMGERHIYRRNVEDAIASPQQAESGAPTIDVVNNEVNYKDYHCHRIALGIPEGGKDYKFSNSYPHEALYDHIQGLSFTKGCFIGQEVVSRMQHRNATKKRIVQVTANQTLPESGTEITAGPISLGVLGSSCGQAGLALIRTDRLAEVGNKDLTPTAEGVAVKFTKPDWATFDLK